MFILAIGGVNILGWKHLMTFTPSIRYCTVCHSQVRHSPNYPLSYTLEINQLSCVFYAKMNHFEVHLMVLLRVVDSKVLRVAKYFFLIKRQNGESNVKKFRRCFYGMSPYALAFKVRFLQVASVNFESELMNIGSRHLSSNFAHSCLSLPH